MTQQVAHTPGPWIRTSNDAAIYGPQYEHVCTLAHNAKERANTRLAFNARLIAAAPELLRLHEQIVALTGWDEHGATLPKAPYCWETVARIAVDLAASAIAAAIGKSEEHDAWIAATNSEKGGPVPEYIEAAISKAESGS